MSVCRSAHYLVIKRRHSHVLDLVAVSWPVGITPVRLSVTLSLMQRMNKRYSIVLFCCCIVLEDHIKLHQDSCPLSIMYILPFQIIMEVSHGIYHLIQLCLFLRLALIVKFVRNLVASLGPKDALIPALSHVIKVIKIMITVVMSWPFVTVKSYCQLMHFFSATALSIH